MLVSCLLSEHRGYLADDARISAYDKALKAVVKRGAVVLDLGSGTGIMGLLACRAGAGRVYSVEVDSIIGLTREICRVNGFLDRVTFVRGLSTELELPEKVDVVVADQIGNFGLNAGLIRFFSDARQRFLKPQGALVPSSVDLYAAPVECPEVFEEVEFWCEPRSELDFSPVYSTAANTAHSANFQRDQLLAGPALLASLDLSVIGPGALSGSASFTVDRDGMLHGIGSWFSAQLSKDVAITNSPLETDAIKRRHLFFPIRRPIPVSTHDRVELRIRSLAEESVITWCVEVPGKASFTHSTWNSMLLSEEDLRKARPTFVPTLRARGKARLTVLSLCDGTRAVSEIEQELFRRHPTLFRSIDEAATFVAEVVTRYAQ